MLWKKSEPLSSTSKPKESPEAFSLDPQFLGLPAIILGSR